jgi:hypothetical protein
VSDALDAPVRISTEAVGRARDFIRRVTAEDQQFLRQYPALLRPVKERHARYPGRKLRPDMLAEMGRRWRYQMPAKFRISYTAHTATAKGNITERRLGIGRIERIDDPPVPLRWCYRMALMEPRAGRHQRKEAPEPVFGRGHPVMTVAQIWA